MILNISKGSVDIVIFRIICFYNIRDILDNICLLYRCLKVLKDIDLAIKKAGNPAFKSRYKMSLSEID